MQSTTLDKPCPKHSTPWRLVLQSIALPVRQPSISTASGCLPHPTPSGGRADFDFAGVVFLTDYYANLLQAWFRTINSIFAVNCAAQSIPCIGPSLSIGPCTSCQHRWWTPSVPFAGPRCCCQPLQRTTEYQRSYGLSTAQKTARLLDHPGMVTNKPSV